MHSDAKLYRYQKACEKLELPTYQSMKLELDVLKVPSKENLEDAQVIAEKERQHQEIQRKIAVIDRNYQILFIWSKIQFFCCQFQKFKEARVLYKEMGCSMKSHATSVIVRLSLWTFSTFALNNLIVNYSEGN